jgi:flagellar export protein FliJ
MPTTTDRWEAIARLRATIRDERQLELAARERAQADLKDELARVLSALDQWQAEARHALAGQVDLQRLKHARAGIVALSCQHQQVLSQCQAAAGQVEQGRQALLEADREVKVLERLEARQQAAEHALEARRETAILDDFRRPADAR